MADLYDVALWRYFQPKDLSSMGEFPLAETVEAESGLWAIEAVMRKYQISWVLRAAVCLVSASGRAAGPVDRYGYLCLYEDDEGEKGLSVRDVLFLDENGAEYVVKRVA
jgi:hypothetical protein